MAYFRQRGNKWSFTADFGRDPITNKRNQVTRSGFNSKEEAEEAHELLKAQYDSGNTELDPSRMTVKEFMDYWLTSYCKRNLAIRTYENRVYLVNGRILPALGHYKLKDMTAIIINRFYAELDKKYEASYIKSIHSVLNKSMEHAVKWGLLAKNFMQNVDAPKLKKKKKLVWSLEQIDHYLTTAKEAMDSNYYIAILNYTYTGARRGEALGLRWSDIDFERNVFSIEQAVVDTRAHGAFIQGTKTDSSKRLVELPEFLSRELKWHKRIQEKHIDEMGREYKDNDLVAAKPNGDPLYPNWVLQKHKKHVEKIGLPYIPIHGLRHTHATALLQAGVHPKIVQERLGHSSITTTLDIYSHVTPNMQKEAIQVFDEKMKNSKKDKVSIDGEYEK